jgi:hypothetical protein
MKTCSSCSCSCLGCGCLFLLLPLVLLLALLGGVFGWLFPEMQFYIEPVSQALQGGADFLVSLVQAVGLLI